MQREEQRKIETRIISRVCQEYHPNEKDIHECTCRTSHSFYRLKPLYPTMNKACLTLFFSQPHEFLLAMLTTEIIFLEENFPVSLPHYCKLPVPLLRSVITFSRKLTWWGMCLKASASKERKFLFCFVLFSKALLFTCGVPSEVMDYFLKIDTFGLAQFSVAGKYSAHAIELNA